jgi:hypothetical protein
MGVSFLADHEEQDGDAPVNSSLDHRPREPRAAVVRHIMHWGCGRGQQKKIGQGNVQGPICHLSLYVASTLHQQGQGAAIPAVGNLATRLRHMVRRISVAGFPARWQEERWEERSHDSGHYGTRFMLLSDEASWTKL